MAEISLREKDFLDRDIGRFTKRILSTIEDSRSQIRFVSHVLNLVSQADQVLSVTKPTYLEQLIETELQINSQNQHSLEKFKKEYEACFKFFTKQEYANYIGKTNKVRGTVLELIVERIIKDRFQSPDYYKMGCQILINGNLISLKDKGIEGAPSTIDFAGISSNSLEGYECKTTPDAFGNSPNHVRFLHYLVNTLLGYSIDAKIGCLILEGKRGFMKRMRKMYLEDYPDIMDVLDFLTVGEILKTNSYISK